MNAGGFPTQWWYSPLVFPTDSYLWLTQIQHPGPDPEIGGLYELSVLSDFDSRLFDPKNTTRLAQRELLGKDGKLIGPWDMPAALRPGTLVAVEANFIVYSFCKKTDPGTVCVSTISFCEPC